jgi:hypothetical protein
MSMVIPERSFEQRMDALARANYIKNRRAQFKRDLKADRILGHDLLLEPPDWLRTMKIIDFLMALPHVGKAKTHKLLFMCRMSASKTVGGLSSRQRTELVSILQR